VGKRSKSRYHYQITPLVKDRLSLCALKYIYSKATYRLNDSITPFQCSKWGKGANYVTIIRSLHSLSIDHHYVHSNRLIQRQLTGWVQANHTISQCSKWGKGANHVTIIRSLHSSRVDYHYVHSNTSIQRQLTSWEWVSHTISQYNKWRKKQIMLPLSDHFTCQG